MKINPRGIPGQGRQGDILLHRVAELPKDCVLLKPGEIAGTLLPEQTKPDQLILALGEVTGHSHTLDLAQQQVEVFAPPKAKWVGDVCYLRITNRPDALPDAKALLRHDEHGAFPAAPEPGIYLVKRQVEAFLDEPRLVAD